MKSDWRLAVTLPRRSHLDGEAVMPLAAERDPLIDAIRFFTAVCRADGILNCARCRRADTRAAAYRVAPPGLCAGPAGKFG
jgi:hypothetical protein